MHGGKKGDIEKHNVKERKMQKEEQDNGDQVEGEDASKEILPWI